MSAACHECGNDGFSCSVCGHVEVDRVSVIAHDEADKLPERLRIARDNAANCHWSLAVAQLDYAIKDADALLAAHRGAVEALRAAVNNEYGWRPRALKVLGVEWSDDPSTTNRGQ